MMKSKIGPVTAYADAVAAGYKGTREEFAKLIACFADSAKQVSDDAEEVRNNKEDVSKLQLKAKESEEKTGKDREEVETMKQSVELSKIQVEENLRQTEGLKNQAQTSAENAALSEHNAKESENAAAVSRTGAETAEESARQYAQEVLEHKNAVEQNVSGFDGKVAAAVEAIQNKGAETLASIPEDYTALQKDVGELKGDLVELSDKVKGFVKIYKNILEPSVGDVGTISVQYRNDSYILSGTGEGKRVVVGTVTTTESGQYDVYAVDNNGNGKPAFYICDGSTVIHTWSASNFPSTKTKPLLEGGKTYTFEGFFAKGTEYNCSLGIEIANGTITEFEPLKYGIDVSSVSEKEFKDKASLDLSRYNFSILGVSIDTYTGYIPSPNVSYYTEEKLPSVEMTWWKKLMNKTGLNLVINNSWSGSHICTKNGIE